MTFPALKHPTLQILPLEGGGRPRQGPGGGRAMGFGASGPTPSLPLHVQSQPYLRGYGRAGWGGHPTRPGR